MFDQPEFHRLSSTYNELRKKLLDLTKKNRMLNYPVGSKIKRQLQIVDDVLESVYAQLTGSEAPVKLAPLAAPSGVPADEKTDEFQAAFGYAKLTDVEYLTGLKALEAAGGENEAGLDRLNRQLGDRVREQLGLPARRKRAEINRNDHARSLGIDPNPELSPASETQPGKDRVLQTLKYPDELGEVIDKIAAEARLSEQETGVSTLFLSFGFLEMYESDSSDQPLFAPLLLLPIKIVKTKYRGKDVFSVVAREDRAEANVSLREYLEERFGRQLPDFDEDEESPASIEAYFEEVASAVDGLARWRVRRWLVLGHFAFSRIAIYHDTDPARWPQHPLSNGLVGALVRGYELNGAAEAISFQPPEDYVVDSPEVEALVPILIQDADASQHSALVDVMKGKNLVIQGPPGTGKSQTITNIIANGLAEGKSVLFLAEKQAALNVVKTRLDRAGLGDFCLELHSDKLTPRAVIESIRARHELGATPPADLAPVADPTWNFARAQLAEYLEDLHGKAPDGTTTFGLIWRSILGRHRQSAADALWNSVALPPDLLDKPERVEEVVGRLEIFAKEATAFGARFGLPKRSPWRRTPPLDLRPYDHDAFFAALNDLRAASATRDALIAAHAEIGLDADHADAAIAIDAKLGAPPQAIALANDIATLDLAEATAALDLHRAFLTARNALTPEDDLSPDDEDELARVEAIWPKLLDGHRQLTPSAFFETATTELSLIRDYIALTEPLLSVEGGLNVPIASCRVIDALASAILIIARIDPMELPLFCDAPADAERFAALKRQWETLTADEAALRAELKPYGDRDWPDVAELELAASEVAKRGFLTRIGRLFGGGGVAAAKALVQRLHLPWGQPKTAVLVRRLAKHRRALADFLDNPDNAACLGARWAGLATPMPAIERGVSLRLDLAAQLAILPHGKELATHLSGRSQRDLQMLALLAAAADAYWKQHHRFAFLIADGPVQPTLHALRLRAEQLARACDEDPERRLGRFERSFAALRETQLRLARCHRAEEAVRAAPLGLRVAPFARDVAAIEAARAVVAWVEALNAIPLPAPLRDRLLDERAGATRAALRDFARAYPPAEQQCRAAIDRLSTAWAVSGLDAVPAGELGAHLDALIAHRGELADFVGMARERQALVDAGLEPLLSELERLELSPAQWVPVFRTLAAHSLAKTRRRASTALTQRTGQDLEAKRQAFAERDRAKIVADRKVVRGRLLQIRPPEGVREGPIGQWTEMHLLATEFVKQRRFTPVRGLLRRAGRATQALKPCFMMSPLSLAKFLPPGALEFDLLVIDEASQMRPEDAIGAMMRARQIVVVGDQKQLPPTDFFMRSDDAFSDEDEGAAEIDGLDDESILERCYKVFNNVRQLKWHYRSRCESLIRFSNTEFYSNNLITFPAARPGSFSVDLVRVDGVFQSRCNLAEAERVVSEAVLFMRHHVGKDANDVPSLGIIALNVEQRELIAEMFHRFNGDPAVETYLEAVRRKQEDFFIKNLENVQGDERDYIFISMTYAKEPGSRLLKQNFGPIVNRQGHRRLNVLFSRARLRMAVFTSFSSVDVRPGPTSHEGPHVLKRYLEYAETRGRAAVQQIGGASESEFEQDVADRLRARGYAVEMQVGVSGYRIDLAVRHPDHPDFFLAGIECDGASYHSSKSARDRDRIRQEVLEGLGWNLLRVWSTDWFDDPDRQMERLASALTELAARPLLTESGYQVGAIGEPAPLGEGGAAAPTASVVMPPPKKPVRRRRKAEEEPEDAARDDADA